MSHERNGSPNPTQQKAPSPVPEAECFVFDYDSEGRRVERSALEADPPIILLKEESTASSALESAPQTVSYEGVSVLEDTAPNHERYAWTGREQDPDTSLQFNRARFFDPTIGSWIGEDPLGNEPASDILYPYPSSREDKVDDLPQ